MHTKQADNFISIANYHNHQIIFHKGQEARDIFIIEDGWVEIFDPSTDRVISLLKKGHLIGEQALCQLGIRIASARARGEVRCQQLPIENVRKLLSLDYGFITAVLADHNKHQRLLRLTHGISQLSLGWLVQN